jgi:hypothetical protein
MYQAQVAKAHIEDLVRAAEADRRARAARGARAGEARGRVRRVTRAVASLVLWPIRH